MCIQRNFIDKFESICKFSLVLFILKERIWDKMLNVKRIPVSVTLTRMYIYWFIENNVELDTKIKFKFMKTLWRHENAGLIRLDVRYVINCKQYQNEISSFCLHTRYHVTCICTHPISKNIDQLRSIELYRETYLLM